MTTTQDLQALAALLQSGGNWIDNSSYMSSTDRTLEYSFTTYLPSYYEDPNNSNDTTWFTDTFGDFLDPTNNNNPLPQSALDQEYLDNAIDGLLIGAGNSFRVSFSDVADIEFSKITDPNLAQITIGELNFTHPADPLGLSFIAEDDVEDTFTGSYDIPDYFDDLTNYYDTVGGDVWFDVFDVDEPESNPSDLLEGNIDYWLLMHELAHSIGLVHLPFMAAIDNQKYSIMSYNTHSDMGASVYPSGLQIYDILAIQDIYGRDYATRDVDNTGSQAYKMGNGFGSTSTVPFIYTIWDGGGEDLIDASDYSDATQIDLRQGAFSSIGKKDATNAAEDNVAIAYYTVIENAKGTDSTTEGDILIGNAWDNDLYGEDGDDKIYGGGIIYGEVTTLDDDTDDDHGYLGWEAVPAMLNMLAIIVALTGSMVARETMNFLVGRAMILSMEAQILIWSTTETSMCTRRGMRFHQLM